MASARTASLEASARPRAACGDGTSRHREQRGQGTVEYGLLIAAAALFVIVGTLFMAGGIESLFERTGSAESPGGAEQPVLTPPTAGPCDPSYQGVCVPRPPPDLDCDDLVQRGIPVPVTVVGDDPHGLDPDGDGLGC